MEYNIGDKVKIREDLVVGEKYNGLTYRSRMNEEVVNKGRVVTIISKCTNNYGVNYYEFDDFLYNYSEGMIEGLDLSTDREKFEAWIKTLCSLKYDDDVFEAFDICMSVNPDSSDFDKNLKFVSDFLFGEEKKKMTKAEIEAELGYDIDIVEERKTL